MAAVTICNDFGGQKIKSVTVSTVSPSICHEVMGPDAMILVFWQYCCCHLFFWPQGMWDPSFPTRDQTPSPCIGKWSLNHWTTKEIPPWSFVKWTDEARKTRKVWCHGNSEIFFTREGLVSCQVSCQMLLRDLVKWEQTCVLWVWQHGGCRWPRWKQS